MNTGDQDYQALQKIFLEALELRSPEKREAYLKRACAGDATRREAIEALLKEYEEDGASVGSIRADSPVTPDSAMFVPGKVLAERYRIVTLLGKGGMGEVYRADDLTLEQPVALKFLPAALAQDERLLKALYNEVRLARRVTHRNVGRVFDIGEAEGLHFLSMEYIEGEDLGALLKQIGRLPVDKAIELGHQLCVGLQAAHEEGLLHLDLKPGNLMIDKRGDVRITDFGLARLATEAAVEKRRSGTPAYMAPEQLLHGEASAHSDIYAVGLVLYEMVTGRRVHSGGCHEEVLLSHQSGDSPEPPSRAIADMDREVEQIILQCLEQDPGNRPQSLTEVLEKLTVAAAFESLPTADELENSDVYISFAAVDDQPLSAEHEGWISQLQHDLEMRIQKLSGGQVRVCKLNKPTPGRDDAVNRVLEYLPTVKTLVSVVSPPFVHASGCLQEVETFWNAADRNRSMNVSGTTRILRAIKTPVDLADMPPQMQRAFDNASGFEFYDIDPETGRLREYDEALGSRARQHYFQCLYDLAHDVNLVLKSFHSGQVQSGQASATDPDDAKTIFLAECTSDLRPERDRLKRELIERGHTVVPDRSLPTEQPQLETMVRAWLAEADLALHPVGRRYGWIPEGEQCSFIDLQNRWAAECSQASGLRRLIWIPSADEAEDARQKELILSFQEDPDKRIGAEVFGGKVNALKDLILQRLISPSGESQTEASAEPDEVSPPQVYLIADPNDEEKLAELEDHLFDCGFEVRLPDFEATEEAEISAAHRANMLECDAVLIYYGAVRRAWVETKLRELMKASGFGRKMPFLTKAVYIAPPFDGRKERFKTHLADIIRQHNGFEPELLSPLVSFLRTSS